MAIGDWIGPNRERLPLHFCRLIALLCKMFVSVYERICARSKVRIKELGDNRKKATKRLVDLNP